MNTRQNSDLSLFESIKENKQSKKENRQLDQRGNFGYLPKLSLFDEIIQKSKQNNKSELDINKGFYHIHKNQFKSIVFPKKNLLNKEANRSDSVKNLRNFIRLHGDKEKSKLISKDSRV